MKSHFLRGGFRTLPRLDTDRNFGGGDFRRDRACPVRGGLIEHLPCHTLLTGNEQPMTTRHQNPTTTTTPTTTFPYPRETSLVSPCHHHIPRPPWGFDDDHGA